MSLNYKNNRYGIKGVDQIEIGISQRYIIVSMIIASVLNFFYLITIF